jgi:hypothetical protein
MYTTSSATAIVKSKGRARATNDPAVPLASSRHVQARRRRDLVSIYLTALLPALLKRLGGMNQISEEVAPLGRHHRGAIWGPFIIIPSAATRGGTER